ncbi:MAG: urate hydroxylase PuuD [Candidatus Sericytochromatia bacterium]
MLPHMNEWLNLILRWMHLLAGIAWIGSSFFFVWLDSHLDPPKEEKPNVEGELWMVHSGGFYLVEKYLIKPGWVPDKLHWFKWEATFTWITGFFLLGVVYYMGGAVYLLNPDATLPKGLIMAIGLGLLPVGWLVYDLLWKYVFANHGKVGAAVSYLLTVAAAFGLSHILSGRALFIHIGALFGTLMVANVWMRILPAQQKMIDATQRGEVPDYTPGKRAKQRSMHNNYMTLPVLFMMISNHFPSTYGQQHNWLVLAAMILVGAGIRHFMNVRNAFSRFTLTAAIAGAFALFFYTKPPVAPTPAASTTGTVAADAVSFEQVNTIIQNRCVTCHSAHPTDDVFKTAPQGAMYDTPAQIKSYAQLIKSRAVDSQTMPLGNKTGMTPEERAVLGAWIAAGAQIP